MPLRCSAMALRDQRHPLGTGAKDVELLEGDADDLETTVLAALTDEVSVIRVQVGSQPPDLLVSGPKNLLLLIHLSAQRLAREV
jgi:hypothetical protein